VRAAAEALFLDDENVAPWLPLRPARGHKATNGYLACVCGSLDYAGAALLSATAAARAGAGMVMLAVPASLQPLFAGRVPEAITLALPDGEGDIDTAAALSVLAARQPAALLVGPGLPERTDYTRLLLALLAGQGVPEAAPMVIDAGALNMLSSTADWWRQTVRRAVLTPHPGEFARLTGESVEDDDEQRAERALAAADLFGQVVVLKGAGTVIAAPDGRLARALFVNPALASAGTGDVLAGTIGALLAQGVAPFEAACGGVYLHGSAAAKISERLGDAGLLASDLPLEIAYARHRLSRLRDRPGSGRVGFTRR
jgi:ADP-dependent NAD(P)H-hydrate dehydratase / NAD(P)H-hydrate epimerase